MHAGLRVVSVDRPKLRRPGTSRWKACENYLGHEVPGLLAFDYLPACVLLPPCLPSFSRTLLSDERWESVPSIFRSRLSTGLHPVHLFGHYALSCVILIIYMAVYKNNAFSRRLPDLVTEELVLVLSQKRSYQFKQLFEVVHENLRRRNAANGGEEMLRLRAYEKLQYLVFSGAVKKNGKIYTGTSALAAKAPHAAAITSNP